MGASQPLALPVILTQLLLKEVQHLVQHLEHSVIALGLQVVGEVLLVLVCQAPEGGYDIFPLSIIRLLT